MPTIRVRIYVYERLACPVAFFGSPAAAITHVSEQLIAHKWATAYVEGGALDDDNAFHPYADGLLLKISGVLRTAAA